MTAIDAESAQFRERVFDGLCLHYQRQGYNVVARSALSVQLMKPKTFSFAWALLWLVTVPGVFILYASSNGEGLSDSSLILLLGVGIAVYLVHYLTKRNEMLLIELTLSTNEEAGSIWCEHDQQMVDVARTIRGRIGKRNVICGLCPQCGLGICGWS